MKITAMALMCLVMAELAHSQEPKKSEAASLQGHDEIISQLRTAYAAFNRGDFDAAVAVLVPKIEFFPKRDHTAWRGLTLQQRTSRK